MPETEIRELKEKIDVLIRRVDTLEVKVDNIISILSPAGERTSREMLSFITGATVSLIGIMYLAQKIAQFIRFLVKGG